MSFASLRAAAHILAAATLFMAGGAMAAPSPQPLLAPAQLDSIRQGEAVRVIDIRPAEEYAANHIPGAVSAPYGQWRGPADNPGKLPPVDKLAALVSSLGVSPDSHAVVVSSGANDTDFGASARVYWTLKYLGMTNLSVLNGGMKAWAAAGLPQDKVAPKVAATQFKPVLNESILATQAHVEQHLNNSKTRLVDARPANFFAGETKAPTAKVPGTIKGAVNLPHSKWFKPGTSEFVSAEEAKKIAAASFPEQVDETISFCNTGHWASTDWFALSEVVGVKNVRMYPESMAGWTQSAQALPMDNVPSRGDQLIKSLKGLIGKS